MAVLPDGGAVESNDRQATSTRPAGRIGKLVVDADPKVGEITQQGADSGGLAVSGRPPDG
jgi:hypothetical protein